VSWERWSDWLDDAEDDLAAAKELYRAGRFAKACFLAQQAAEKALKALLIKRGGVYEPDLLADLGCPVGGSLVPPIGRGFIRHLGGGRGGRSSPHVASPEATPQATTHVRNHHPP